MDEDQRGKILGRSRYGSRSDPIIISYNVKTWAEDASCAGVYRNVLSSHYLLPQDFEVEVGSPVTLENFRYFACNLANWLRPNSFSLNETFDLEASKSVLLTQIAPNLLRRISGEFDTYMGLGIYEKNSLTAHKSVDEVLYLFSLNKKHSSDLDDSIILEGRLVIDINEIASSVPHNMRVTYENNKVLVEADRRNAREFRLDRSGPQAEINRNNGSSNIREENNY
ncbi:hypothetical protein J4437_04685 [Candidatus Woesearchaeota archaeon]|nr:hypothetical protein [Candidatus Woesearchaeota archaeon]